MTVGEGDKRASDADREAVASLLHGAMGEGRLDLTEVEERLGATYAARTYAELEAVVADLPDQPLPWRPRPAPAFAPDVAAVLIGGGWSGEKRAGEWEVPRRITVRSGGSDVKLDFRSARCPHDRVDIELQGGMGSLLLVLPADWSVDTDGLHGGWGTIRNRHRAAAGPGKPKIVVTGKLGMSSVTTRGAYFWE